MATENVVGGNPGFVEEVRIIPDLVKMNMDFVGGRGTGMPSVGLGCWKIPKDITADTVYTAIKLGYRHLDCACDYGNEVEVGQGIARAIADGLVTRGQLWVTSKLWNTYHKREHVKPALQKTLSDLGLDYLDLYLIHFPIPLKYVDFETRYPPEWVHDPSAADARMVMEPVPVRETWEAMEAVHGEGLCRAVGVANFSTALLRDLLSYAVVRPAVLQVERHVYLQQPKLLRFCQQNGIHLTGFSPLGAGSYVCLNMETESDSALVNPVVGAIAARLHRTPAQVLLRWGVQQGCSVIPKSSRSQRLAENLALFDFQLSGEDMAQLAALDQHRRFNDPGVFCEGMGCFCPIFD